MDDPAAGTGPHQHVERVFAEQCLGMPDVIVRTRSITVLKSLVVDSGFLSWMADPMFEPERRAGLIAPLRSPGSMGGEGWWRFGAGGVFWPFRP
jgi:hypothetical protein